MMRSIVVEAQRAAGDHAEDKNSEQAKRARRPQTQVTLLEHGAQGPADELLATGDLLVDVEYSSLNYKDALALRGDPGVVRTLPLIPGIDVVGTVRAVASRAEGAAGAEGAANSAGAEGAAGEDSDESLPTPRFAVGDVIVANGAGMGEFRHGGYTSRVWVDSQAAVALPAALSAQQAGALGTAGYTAALCVQALCDAGLQPADGPVIVTGATGGVGSVAVHLLGELGYHVVALTRRTAEHAEYLRALGAAEIADAADFAQPGRPLQKGTYAGAVDTVGSQVLVNVLAQVRWGGAVAACGLAGGADLPGTVLPFILRSVRLLGVDSVQASVDQRERAWELLATTLRPAALAAMTQVIELDEVEEAGAELLAGKRFGRTAVRIG